MNRRAGLSLAEVLIAIFVLAIGLLGVLSLFPLGAVRMAQAIKDDRCAIIASNTAAMTKWVWKDELGIGGVARIKYPFPAPVVPFPNSIDPFVNAMDDPNYPFNPDLNLIAAGSGDIPAPLRTTTSPFLPPYWTTASYPVLVDPVGWNVQGAATLERYWVGGDTRSIPRRSLRRIEYYQMPASGNLYVGDMATFYPGAKPVLLSRYFVQLDDLGFGVDGTPIDGTGTTTANLAGVAAMQNQIQRDGRYSCALLMKRQRNQIVSEMDMSIVVYSGRSLDTPSSEKVFEQAIFVKGSTEAFITYTGERPDLRKGKWILDATMTKQMPNGTWAPDPMQHGYFYRIINVAENTSGVLTLELQEPAQESTVYPNGNGYGIAVVMDNVVEVFPGKGLSPSTRPVP